MPERDSYRITEIGEKEVSAYWVNAPLHGNETPDSSGAKFVLEKRGDGSMTLAVKGYDGGRRQEAMVIDDRLSVVINNEMYPVLDFTARALPIDLGEYAEYMRSISEPERESEKLLIQVLERRTSGVWTLLSPGLYNDYDSFAELSYLDPNHIGLRWGGV